jgi:putative nucleotidyltransferase with HDIG domain
VSGHVHRLGHLIRRFASAVSSAPPSAADDAWAVGLLSDGEALLWWQMQAQDRRHSISVARRFVAAVDEPTRDAIAAALLHDVGKSSCRLGTAERVVATIVGPRTERFRCYHDHERIGAEMLRDAGASAATIALVDGTSTDDVLRIALRRADDI